MVRYLYLFSERFPSQLISIPIPFLGYMPKQHRHMKILLQHPPQLFQDHKPNRILYHLASLI